MRRLVIPILFLLGFSIIMTCCVQSSEYSNKNTPVETTSTLQTKTTPVMTVAIPHQILVNEDFSIVSDTPKVYSVRGPKTIHLYIATSDEGSIVNVWGWKSDIRVDRFGNEVISNSGFTDWIATADRFSVIDKEITIPENEIHNIQLTGKAIAKVGYGINNGHILIETL